jgi:Ala-tRNA(Pro) deacylase
MLGFLRKEETIMFYVSEIYTTAPKEIKTKLQGLVYKSLTELGIDYQRVDTDVAVSMEDCSAIDKKLQMEMVKTLFLCDENKEQFYLFVTSGNKRFASKAFSSQLNCKRVSFAPVELFESMLGASIGAATVFSVLLDRSQQIKVVFDRSVMDQEYYGCSDGTTTGFMKIKTSDIVTKFLPSKGHEAVIIDD